MWPAVAPNGHVYIALANLALLQGGLQDQWIYRSTDGGSSWTRLTIASGQRPPLNLDASENCTDLNAFAAGFIRPALRGNLRVLPSPQIAIHADPTASAGYVIHAIYMYDSDGAGPDESNVFYRRSTDGAVGWSDEVLLNTDGTTADQWHPTVSADRCGTIAASWYDRRLDAVNNLAFDRFAAQSLDGGLSWGSNVGISDVTSPVAETKPYFEMGIVDCYHGDYDQLASSPKAAHMLWSDDRRVTGTGPKS
jgi:hypothetical protein